MKKLDTLRELMADPFDGRGLTPRQKQVAALRAKGLSLAAIGAKLHIAPDTVKTHLQRVYSTLGTNDLTGELIGQIEAVLAVGASPPAQDKSRRLSQ